MSTAPDELDVMIPAGEATAAQTQVALTELEKRIGAMSTKEVQAELVAHRDAQVKLMTQQVFKFKFRVKNLHSGINVAKEKRIKLRAMSFEQFRDSVVNALRSHQE